MNATKEVIDITPDRSLITKIGQASHYDIWQALSELIDNSIDARIPELNSPVEISIQFEKFGGSFLFGTEGEYDLEISDSGKGMHFDEFSTCLRLAYVDKLKEKLSRLGKFGLGLKTSLSSLGSKFKIISKAYNNNERYSLVFDEKDFIEKGEWSKFRIIKEIDASDWHGTIIKIKTRKETKFYKEKITRLKEKFGLQYSYLIQNDVVKIKVNTTFVKPVEPELEKDPDRAPDGKFPLNFTLSTGQKVRGWFGFRVLGVRSGVVSQLNYGFHIFWRQRLVAEYEKIGIRIHTDFQRLIGELHFEDFPVTHDKTNILRDSDAYDALAGPRKEDDPSSREFKRGELWPHIHAGFELFVTRQKERMDLYRQVDKAIENRVISLGTGRSIKNKIKKKEITTETVKSVLDDEAKRTQETVQQYLGSKESREVTKQNNLITSSISSNSSERTEFNKRYQVDTPNFDGYSLFYKLCNAEEADLIVVRDRDRIVKKYLDKHQKEVLIPKYFEEQN